MWMLQYFSAYINYCEGLFIHTTEWICWKKYIIRSCTQWTTTMLYYEVDHNQNFIRIHWILIMNVYCSSLQYYHSYNSLQQHSFFPLYLKLLKACWKVPLAFLIRFSMQHFAKFSFLFICLKIKFSNAFGVFACF